MTEVLLFHHIQGLTDGVRAFADDLRAAGHVVHTPDLFDGRTFESIEDGFAHARSTGFDVLRAKGTEIAEGLRPDLVHMGFSFGVTIAQRLAQTRPGARGAVLLHSCLPLAEFGGTWPADVPGQIHGMTGDEFFEEDLPAARELVAQAPQVALFEYEGDQHLFTDRSLDAWDEAAAGLVLQRVLGLLETV